MADLNLQIKEDLIGGPVNGPVRVKHLTSRKINDRPELQPVLEKFKSGLDQTGASKIDEETPVYNSRIIITYVEYLKIYHKDIDIDSILQYAGMTRHEVEDPGHWFSQYQADRFNEILVARTGNPNIAREAGRFTVSSKRVGAALQYALGLINLASVYHMIGKLAPTMSRGAAMTARKLGGCRMEIISTPEPGTVEKRYQCENRFGTLESVTRILSVDKIVDTVVGIMAKHLNFDRGMIMLADPGARRLKLISGFGYNREQEKLLHSTEFNLVNPDSKGHFVRCFNELKSFLVNDISEIEPDLSPGSREFIRQMAVQSFICVPIVYEKKALGVLAVENTNSRQHLAQSEISVLMGVASQTAASIINARSFKEIKKSARRYRLLADNISDVIWTLDLSLSKFAYVSPSVERVQGYTPEELMELDLEDTLTPRSFGIARKAITEELVKEKNRSADP